jgi:hypothetical protein
MIQLPPTPAAQVNIKIDGATKSHPNSSIQNSFENNQYKEPESSIAAGNVNTQAMSRLRIVAHCKPDLLATMAPATPDESTCVVETGKPYISAAPIVIIATSSADAP